MGIRPSSFLASICLELLRFVPNHGPWLCFELENLGRANHHFEHGITSRR